MPGDESNVLRRKIESALKRGQKRDAAELLGRLRQLDPLSAATRGLELQYLVRHGSPTEAALLGDHLAGQFPGSAGILHWTGRAAYRTRNYELAERTLRESNRLSQSWMTSWWLAKTLTALGHLIEAEALLVSLVPDHPFCEKDLAWMFERKGEMDRAMQHISAYLERWPDDEYAQAQKLRLGSRTLSEPDLRSEVEGLIELGEEIPPELFARYVEVLVGGGDAALAKTLVLERLPRLPGSVTTSMAWSAYRSKAWLLAVDLFLAVLMERVHDEKSLYALDRAAHHAHVASRVIEAYRALLPVAPHLADRIRTLESKASR
jgi:tetratricopeptide (TPR) repeat protein